MSQKVARHFIQYIQYRLPDQSDGLHAGIREQGVTCKLRQTLYTVLNMDRSLLTQTLNNFNHSLAHVVTYKLKPALYCLKHGNRW